MEFPVSFLTLRSEFGSGWKPDAEQKKAFPGKSAVTQAYRRLSASLLLMFLPLMAAAQGDVWTLESAIQRVVEIAPEMRAADAEVAAREGELTQAGSFPNPSIEARADDKLGLEDGRGGTDLTQLALSQPLPLRRLSRQRAAAEASLESARANRRHQRLLLEREVARAFHALQLTAAKRRLAEERLQLQLIAEYPSSARRKTADRLVRYLSPLERRRLAVLREEANQAVLAAEREQQQTAIEFRALLALPADAQPEPAELNAPMAPAELEVLARDLDSHPALMAARQELEAARAGIDVAKSQRFADPALNLFRERDFLNDARRNVTGIGVSVQVPLWNANRGPVDKAKADAAGVQARLDAASRDARSRLAQAHAQLARLLNQTERLRTNLLDPAREVFDLTRRGFAAGESNILALVDANSTYFDARARYLELLQESALAAADLRLALGRSVLNPEAQP